jgi:hypothetical protein
MTTEAIEELLQAFSNETVVAMARELYADEPEKIAYLDEFVALAARIRVARAELEATEREIAAQSVRH